MRIGLYIGSFDPVHIGHENVVSFLLNNDYVDRIVIIPTGDYWNKKINANIEDRINMLKNLENERVKVDTDLYKYTYTYEILDHMHDKYKDDDFYLIIGSDNIVDFDKWKNIDRILENHVIVLIRDDTNVEEYIDRFKQRDMFIVPKNYDQLKMSSTYIRELIKNKDEEYTKYLNSAVIDYIKKKHLYENLD